jgi:two-component sensor histidine kinase
MSAIASPLTPDELVLRLNQQELVAEFSLFALEATLLQPLLDEACRIASEGLKTELAKVLRYRPIVQDLLVVAGLGWHAGVVGNSTLGSGLDSPAGFALHTGEPTISNALSQEQRFRVPALLAEHAVQSAINVLIGGEKRERFGVLEVDSTRRHEFVQADTAFLQALANVLAAGMTRIEAEAIKDGLLHDKDLLMREVHHRVKNSLQLVRTMLGLQSRNASNETRQALDSAAARIMSIAAVHHRLYEGGSVEEADASIYLEGLIDDLRKMLVDLADGRTIHLDAQAVMLSADNLTPLGLIVSELVTNAFKHAAGDISIKLRSEDTRLRLIVEDGGLGFPPEGEMRGGLGMRLVTALAKGKGAPAVTIDRSVAFGRVVVDITR